MENIDNIKNTEDNDNEVKLLNGDNKVDVEIEPDVKSNNIYIQICSFSIIFHCFSNNKK